MASFDVDALDLAVLRERQSAKYRFYDADVIPAWVAEMDFPLAAPIADALHAAIDRSDTGYRSATGLAEALGEFASDRWGWSIPVDRITPVPDVLVGIGEALLVLTEPGDGIVVNTPVYPPFFSTVHRAARTLVDVPLVRDADGAYGWDLAGLESAFARPEVTAFLLCNPHNPTGTVPTPTVLAAIAELAEAHGVVIISDEIHGPLAMPDTPHVPLMTVVEDDANAVILVSASKAWNLPGLKCAQLVGSERTAPQLTSGLPIEVTYATGNLGAIAAVAAYRDGGPWLQDVVEVLDGNRHVVGSLLAEHLPAARYLEPDASYLAWIDFGAYGLGDNPAADFVSRARVALSPGPTYGPGGRGFARLNFATSPAILAEIVRRIAAVIQ